MHPILYYKIGANYKMGVHTPTVGFYKMAAHTFRCVDLKCAVGMGLQENGSIVMHVARDSFYKMGAGNFHDQLIPNQPQEKSSMTLSFERRVDLQNGVYKMGWPNPTYPQNQVDIHFILRTTPPILEGGYFWCLI